MEEYGEAACRRQVHGERLQCRRRVLRHGNVCHQQIQRAKGYLKGHEPEMPAQFHCLSHGALPSFLPPSAFTVPPLPASTCLPSCLSLPSWFQE